MLFDRRNWAKDPRIGGEKTLKRLLDLKKVEILGRMPLTRAPWALSLAIWAEVALNMFNPRALRITQ
jgi:hypothetical protein